LESGFGLTDQSILPHSASLATNWDQLSLDSGQTVLDLNWLLRMMVQTAVLNDFDQKEFG
jgi:hypothetical protein